MKTYSITRRHDMMVMATGLTFMQAYGSELDKLNLVDRVDYLIHYDDEPAVSKPTPPCPVQAAWAYL